MRGEGADALAIAQELPVEDESAGSVGEADVHGAQRNLIAGQIGSGGAGDGQRVGGASAAPGAQRHGFGGRPAHRTVLLENLRADAEQLHLHGVAVGEEAAQEIRRAAGDAGETLP